MDPELIPTRRKRVLQVGLAVLGIPAFVSLFFKGALIDQMPFALRAAGLILGAIPALIAAFSRSLIEQSAWGTVKIVAGLIGFGLFLCCYDVRLAYQFAAFENYPAHPGQLMFSITEKSNGKGGTVIYAQADEGAREIHVGVTDKFYYQVQPIRAPGRDCIILDVETGRWGVRRAIVPRRFDEGIDLDRWRQCPNYTSDN